MSLPNHNPRLLGREDVDRDKDEISKRRRAAIV